MTLPTDRRQSGGSLPRPARRRGSLRRGFQLGFLLFFGVLIALTTYPLRSWLPVEFFLRMDPLLFITASLASRTLAAGLGSALAVLALTALFGRFFCGWICPLGTTIELADDLLYRRHKRRWLNHRRVARGLKYVNLIVILIASAAGNGLAFVLDPISLVTRAAAYVLYPAGAFLVNMGYDGLRPLADKAGWLSLSMADTRQGTLATASLAAAAMFVAILMANRLQRRFWCRSLCPLGALLGLAARFTPFQRRVSATCDHDGKCRRVCETGAIAEDETEYDPAECINCQRCVTDCHLGVVTFGPTDPRHRLAQPLDLGRRRLLTGVAGGVFGAMLFRMSPARQIAPDVLIRPPGALPEDLFRKRCIRCGQCIKACPTSTLQPDWFDGGLEGMWAPVVRPRLAPCDQGCNVCGAVCPTGALRSLALDEKRYARLGTAVIDISRCLVWTSNRLCLVCDEACPYKAVYWVQDEKGKRRPYVDYRRCNGCGMCNSACPVLGQGAIIVRPDYQIRLATGSYIREAKRSGYQFEKMASEDEIRN